MNENTPIKLTMNIQGGIDSVIPKGVTERLVIFCRNGSATFRFNDSKTTQRFVISQNKVGTPSRYVERLQTAICLYPEKNKKEISEYILKRLKELSGGKQ